MLLTTTLIF